MKLMSGIVMEPPESLIRMIPRSAESFSPIKRIPNPQERIDAGDEVVLRHDSHAIRKPFLSADHENGLARDIAARESVTDSPVTD